MTSGAVAHFDDDGSAMFRLAPDVAPRTAQAMIVDRLRTEILAGLLAPGTKLRQSAVAARMRTSTTPVREALRELAAERLLDGDPHRGFVIHSPSRAELQELYELRMLLEPVSAVKTALRITEEELARASQLAHQMESERNSARWAVLNREFHAFLGATSGSPLMSDITANLRDRSEIYVALSVVDAPERLKVSNDQHREMLAACRARDRKRVREAVLVHLRGTVGAATSRLEQRRQP